MNYSRCKCGSVQHWGSELPARCSPCKKCGTLPAPGPDLHEEPEPHDFSMVAMVETDEGPRPLTRCRHCLKTRRQLEGAQ